MSLIANIAYYQEHESTLQGLLDEMVEGLRPEPGDEPAFTFASLIESFQRHPGKTVTFAALALMRLAELKDGKAGNS